MKTSVELTDEEQLPEPIVPGVARALSPLVRRILATNPGPHTLLGTNTYLIGIDEIVVIDPGPEDQEQVESIAGCGGDRIRWIVVTREHPEHAGNVQLLAKVTGAEVLEMADGETLLGTEFRITAMAAPGPSAGHRMYMLEEERFLFCGDLMTDGGTAALDPDDGDLGDYLATIDKLANRRLKRIAPAHGHVIEEPKKTIESLLARRAEREAQVIAALESGTATAADVAAALYPGVTEELNSSALAMVSHHLNKLAKDKRAKRRGDTWTLC